jgi:hypothetical protein
MDSVLMEVWGGVWLEVETKCKKQHKDSVRGIDNRKFLVSRPEGDSGRVELGKKDNAEIM